MQPWVFTGFGGKAIEEVRKKYQGRFNSGSTLCPEIPYDPTKWPESFQFRRLDGDGPKLLTVLNIDPEYKQERERLCYEAVSFWGDTYGIIIWGLSL
jgi:hypothetical protein